MLRLLRDRPLFRRLWLAGTLSLVGDWLSFVAVSLLAIDRGGGALSLAVVLAMHALPQALVTPLAGVVVDHFDRRKLLLMAPVVQGSITVVMALFAARGELFAVQGLLFVRGAFTAFVMPAETAALRHTVESDEITRANALVSGTWSVTYVAGMALGGVIAVLGPTPAILLDALSFFAAAALLRGLPAMKPEGEKERPEAVAFLRRMPADLWAALRLAAGRRELFRAVFSKAPVAVAGGAGWVVLNGVAGKTAAFGTAALALGVLQSVRGAGTGIGPLVVSWLPAKSRLAAMAPHLSVAAAFVGILVFPSVESMPVALLAVTLVWGMGGGANWVLSSSALQRLAPDSHVGRLASLDELTMTAAMVGGAFGAAALLEGGTGAMIAALAGVSAGAAAWIGLWTRGSEESSPREAGLREAA